jgi:hypothetical protein
MPDALLEQLQRAGARKVTPVAFGDATFHVRSMSGDLRSEFFRQVKTGDGPPDYWIAAAGLCAEDGAEFMAGKTLAQKADAIKGLDGGLLNALAVAVLKASGLHAEADGDAEGN